MTGVTKVVEHGKTHPQPQNIVSNHVSPLDILFFMYSVDPSFVAKKGVAKSRLIGPLATSFDCVFVDRKSPEDRARAGAAIEERQRIVANGAHERSFVVFPEGTTTNGRYIIPFKSGAFEGNYLVTPCTLIYKSSGFALSYEILPFSIWFPLSLASLGCTSLHAFWGEPMGQHTYCYSPGELAEQTRKKMAVVLHREFEKVWDYDESQRIPDDWQGTFRTKKAVFAAVMGSLGAKVHRPSTPDQASATEMLLMNVTTDSPAAVDEEAESLLRDDVDG
eukprot:Selendium_serpulae@DN6257_c0_g1_i9.p1